jgi:hypothetical protein
MAREHILQVLNRLRVSLKRTAELLLHGLNAAIDFGGSRSGGLVDRDRLGMLLLGGATSGTF